MKHLQYYSHLLLNSKYKLVFNILIYIFVFALYNIILNDITIIECMKRAATEDISQKSTESDREYIRFLENEAWAMDKRIAELESELKRSHDLLNSRTSTIEGDMEQMRSDNKIRDDRITMLESKKTEQKEEK